MFFKNQRSFVLQRVGVIFFITFASITTIQELQLVLFNKQTIFTAWYWAFIASISGISALACIPFIRKRYRDINDKHLTHHLYSVNMAVNTTTMKCSSTDELYPQIVDILHTHGHITSVWIGQYNLDNTITCLSHSGVALEDLYTWYPPNEQSQNINRQLSNNRPYMFNVDKTAQQAGWFPIRCTHTPSLVLGVYSDVPNIFNTTRTDLIVDLANLIGYITDSYYVQNLNKQYTAQLNVLAHSDPLTMLPNRAAFNSRLQSSIEREDRKNVIVMIIDLDKFKIINDTMGHLGGDHILTSVAQRMLNVLRDCDMLARLGGDEFGVIIDLVDGEDACSVATTIAQKLLKSTNSPFTYNANLITIGLSIGVAIYPIHGSNMEQLYNHADAAMYRIKDTGRNGVQIYHGHHNK